MEGWKVRVADEMGSGVTISLSDSVHRIWKRRFNRDALHAAGFFVVSCEVVKKLLINAIDGTDKMLLCDLSRCVDSGTLVVRITRVDDYAPLKIEVRLDPSEVDKAERLELVVEGLAKKIERLERELTAVRTCADQYGCDVPIGKFPNGESTTLALDMSKLPKDVQRILVYAQFESGNSSHDFYPNCEVKLNAHDREYSYPLFVHSYNQSAWSYNSDAIWMPVPQDGNITLSTSVKLAGNFSSAVKIIRYAL
jgi:hypothetical protein